MLYDRLRPSNDQGIIYHYCSIQTFLEIIKNKTLRFSDVSVLNDSEEGKWGYSIFKEAATCLAQGGSPAIEMIDNIVSVDESFIQKIDTFWTESRLKMMNFVSCFSTDGDSLSQWRAYADDGRGVAVGFKVSELKELPIKILNIEYAKETQIREMESAIRSLYVEYVENGKDDSQDWLFNRCIGLIASSISFKNPAWRDEKEVRCHHIILASMEKNLWVLEDRGGTSWGVEVSGEPISFQARNGKIVPYLDMPFKVEQDRLPIDEVVVGPKYQSGLENIQFALGNSGFRNVKLRRAGNAYR